MAFDRCQLAAGCTLESLDCELEEIDQRLWTTGSTAKDLQLGSCRTHKAGIPVGDVACVEQIQQLTEGIGPTTFAVLNHDGLVNGCQVIHGLNAVLAF